MNGLLVVPRSEVRDRPRWWFVARDEAERAIRDHWIRPFDLHVLAPIPEAQWALVHSV